VNIIVNGESREIPEGLSVAGLLSHLDLQPGRVAIERNLDILPRDQWACTAIAAGDHFEIVHFVGGG
jgi:sulfur carrier protein